ncbi:MAG: hypothetical protein J7M14_03025 [Planctomycetes bacterium]|nr:hypothetical protein [Planctomycetota bacterium]
MSFDMICHVILHRLGPSRIDISKRSHRPRRRSLSDATITAPPHLAASLEPLRSERKRCGKHAGQQNTPIIPLEVDSVGNSLDYEVNAHNGAAGNCALGGNLDQTRKYNKANDIYVACDGHRPVCALRGREASNFVLDNSLKELMI